MEEMASERKVEVVISSERGISDSFDSHETHVSQENSSDSIFEKEHEEMANEKSLQILSST